ncbi:phage tail tape measure protein [Xenorhabdus szentirmaii]|uniref:Tapemeasure protein n=1 Tax=Xenorhabdus szentirmaii DSM 16338 TaxID=1427518 RepID=W1IXH7_9GAMM|nr:phage tail tape measure protein [Xenorhabdus szentirmaii]PHM33638.1 phage tail tape measure protein [Xenorhabdus szentirmaii DSM 16338]PHM42292.1 phage tail tape measure protein [Xenorhabdus szentirmaii]CDL83159.1 putative tapemeasure protein [Xenorhabdus szentirmaii DSM 16338]
MANLSTLTVGLLVNATSFKSQIMDAYRYAGQGSQRFSDKSVADANKVKKSYSSLASQIKSVSGQLMMLAGTGFSLSTIISHTRQYGQALSDLSAITGATGEQLKKLDENAQRIGRTTEFGVTRIAEAFKLIASAKPELLKSTEALTLATEKAVILAQASGIDLPDATRALALSLNQFGASAEQADRFINVLAAGAKYGASEINETAQAIKNGGTAAALAGVSFEELGAAIQILAERGIKGGEAGTAMRNVILALERSADKNLKPSVVGLSSALETLTGKKLSTAQAVKLFGRANVSAASNLVTGREKLEQLTQALTGTQVAYEQASARANNLGADLDVLTRAFEGMAVKIGQSADGPLRTGVQNATSAINALSENFSLVASIALHTLIPVMATKLTAGLRENMTAWKATEKAARNVARQQAETAKRTIEQANATLRSTEAQGRHIQYLERTNRLHGLFVNYSKEKRTLIRQETEALKLQTQATSQLEAANRRFSYSYRALSAAGGFARGALAMIGGPFGAAMLAGSALYYFHQRAQEARASATNLKDAVLETKNALMQLSKIELSSRILKYRDALNVQKKETAKIWLDLQGKKNIVSGVGFGGLWANKKKAQEEVIHAEAEYEKALKKMEFHKKQLEESQAALKALEAGEKPKPLSNNQGGGSTGNPWTGNGDDKKGKITQILNQYRQLRLDLETVHTTSLGRIILSEQEVQRKLDEVGQSGLVSQQEIQRLTAFNAENHQKQRLALAEKYAPAKALIRQEKEASEELKALYIERLLSEQEYLSASRTLYQTSVKDKLAEQAKQISAPRLDMMGEVDPVVQLQNQLTEQTALYDTYYRNGLLNKERYEQLMTAAANRSKEAQFAAAKDLYVSQGDFQKIQMELLDVVEQRTGNALTGMLTGTKSFSESMRELSASLAQSIIQDLVRIAMQALITKAISGFFGGAMGSMGASALSSAGGGLSSVGSGTTIGPDVWKSPIMNAKGGVYQSADLSQYSGQVVSSPTLFKFAKGGGVMGEAGPEAILPLKRGTDGKLGVQTTGSTGNQTFNTVHNTVHIVVHSDGTHDTKTSRGAESAGQDIAKFVDQRFKFLLHKSLNQGGELSVAIKGGR